MQACWFKDCKSRSEGSRNFDFWFRLVCWYRFQSWTELHITYTYYNDIWIIYIFRFTHIAYLHHVLLIVCYYSIIFITTNIDYLSFFKVIFPFFYMYVRHILHDNQCSSALCNQKNGIQRMDTEGEVSRWQLRTCRYLWRILWTFGKQCNKFVHPSYIGA